MTGEVIKEFLVGLGFEVDSASLSKFNQSIASATLRVTALYTAVNAAATGIVYAISGVSKGFEDLGYELKILAPAINKALILRQEMYRAYSSAGVDLVKVVQSAAKLNLSFEKTKIALQAVYRSTASRFFELLTKQSDMFRQKIYANMPRIQAVLERMIKFIFKALEAVTTLGVRLWSILTRVYDFFVLLDRETDGWSTKILGLVAAWNLLNLSFLATPLGMLLAGLVAILALFDDFKTWQEGGKSLFDWSSFVPVIEAVTKYLTSMWGTIKNISLAVYELISAFTKLFTLDIAGFWAALGRSGDRIVDVFKNLLGQIKGVWSVLSSVGSWGAQLLGNGNAAANIQGAVGGSAVSPVGSNVQNSQNNQNVQQQTTIHVQGVPDAQAAGKAVSNEQGRVNQQLVRDLRGATR
jgi:hypothetical protein